MLKYVSYDIVFREIPDEVTLAINLSKCPNHCPGCHSPWLQEDEGDVLTEERLFKLLECYGKSITCVCFMGGDAAPDEVARFANCIQKQTKFKIKVGWYSGRAELPSGLSLNAFQYVKLGGYVRDLGPLTSRSTNQRLYQIDTDNMMTDITEKFW